MLRGKKADTCLCQGMVIDMSDLDDSDTVPIPAAHNTAIINGAVPTLSTPSTSFTMASPSFSIPPTNSIHPINTGPFSALIAKHGKPSKRPRLAYLPFGSSSSANATTQCDEDTCPSTSQMAGHANEAGPSRRSLQSMADSLAIIGFQETINSLRVLNAQHRRTIK